MEFTSEKVLVIDGGKHIFISLYNEDEDMYFSLTQADNRDMRATVLLLPIWERAGMREALQTARE